MPRVIKPSEVRVGDTIEINGIQYEVVNNLTGHPFNLKMPSGDKRWTNFTNEKSFRSSVIRLLEREDEFEYKPAKRAINIWLNEK